MKTSPSLLPVYNLQIYSKNLMHFSMKIANFFQIIYFLEQLWTMASWMNSVEKNAL